MPIYLSRPKRRNNQDIGFGHSISGGVFCIAVLEARPLIRARIVCPGFVALRSSGTSSVWHPGRTRRSGLNRNRKRGFEAGRAREAARGEREVVQSELQLERNMTCRELSS